MLKAYGYVDELNSGWIDIEFPQLSKDSFNIGYEPVYVEKTTIGGTIHRRLIGYRMIINWSYPYLLEEQRKKINNIIRYMYSSSTSDAFTQLQSDIQGNPTYASPISSEAQIFNGNVIIDYNSAQTRFCWSEVLGEYVWTNWKFTAKSVSLINI